MAAASMTRLTVLAIFLGLVLPTGSLAAPPGFDYKSHIGIVALQANKRPCLAIRARNLSVGTQLSLIWVPVAGMSRPAQILAAKVTGRQSQLCDFPERAERGETSYSVAVEGRPLTESGPHFALLVPTTLFVRKDATVQGDLDRDGQPEVFRLCTSSEGLHLTVWSGTPLRGTRRWHRYYYLGYNVEPTCEEADYREP